ncbi:hypothetical protein BJX99DRAFT_229033 [Aspergillus californicus]
MINRRCLSLSYIYLPFQSSFASSTNSIIISILLPKSTLMLDYLLRMVYLQRAEKDDFSPPPLLHTRERS